MGWDALLRSLDGAVPIDGCRARLGRACPDPARPVAGGVGRQPPGPDRRADESEFARGRTTRRRLASGVGPRCRPGRRAGGTAAVGSVRAS